MNESLSRFPVAHLADLPTPVATLPHIADMYGHRSLWMKQDNLSGSLYGGNKIRKLEFLLGEALAEGRKRVITYGAIGSNHALATAICCRRLGLKAISILAPQESSNHVRKNILMQHAVGAELHLCPDFTDFKEATKQLVHRCHKEDGIAPYIIPAGGSNATGSLGFVNAAFELTEQVKPDVIYIPMGTGGTLAGLLVGFKLARTVTRIEAVRVVDPVFRNKSHIIKLCDEICIKLGIDPIVGDSDIIIRDAFFGEGYGIPTPEGEKAIDLFHDKEAVYLEGTYTGKASAALLHDLKSGRFPGKTLLFWNTLNSRDFSHDIANIDYRRLPEEFHSCFLGN